MLPEINTAHKTALPRSFIVSYALVKQGLKSVLIYRADVIVGSLSTLLRVILVTLVWQAVYGEREVVSDVSQTDAVGYAVLGALFAVVFQPWQFSTLPDRVRSGNVVFDIMRPVGLIHQTLGRQLGTSVANVPKATLGLALALLIGAIPTADGLLQTLAFMLSATLGLIIALLCNLIVSMTAFWTTDVGGAFVIYTMAASFCSGSLIPLWFMPDGLAATLRALPFSAQIFVPLSIWFDPSPGWKTLGELALQLAWILLLILVANVIWRRAFGRVVINGG